MRVDLSGTGVALVTPFLNGKVDFDGLENLIDHVINGGVNYVVSLGTTGETPTLNPKERFEVLDFTIEKVNKRVKVVAGFGGNNTQNIVQAVKKYSFEGVDAILSSSPAYNKPSQEGIYRHYQAIAEVAPRPIIIYNVPSRTARNISAETTLRLAHDNEQFIAIKEASGDLHQCMHIAKNKPEAFQLLSGDDNMTLPMMSFGAVGVISVIANALPTEFTNMVNAAFKGDFKTASQLHLALLDVVDLLFVEGNPAGVKAALEYLSVCSKEVRLPLVELSEMNTRKLQDAIKELKNQPVQFAY